MTRRRTQDPMGVTGDLFADLEMPDTAPEPKPQPTQNAAPDSAASLRILQVARPLRT